MTEEQRKSIERIKALCEEALKGDYPSTGATGSYEWFHDALALEIERAPEP